jgi:DNA mismatch repair protein MutL
MIAAGEVVEGPHSVVKELVENSLDAGAGFIEIEAEESGFARILIRDNGQGIWREDLPRAVMEHATSKIKTIEDISAISSFGFRGEALSSIASVAKLTMMSRRPDEEIGGKISNASGSFALTDFAGAAGTTVIVENLFYNTPARKKFMKTPAAESRVIRETIEKTALAHYAKSFILTINGTVTRFPACSAPAERIAQVFGREDAAGLVFASVKDLKISVEGFLSRPHHSKGTRSMQFLFVNGRPVEMKSLGFLLTRAYESAMQQGRYPAAVLFVSIPPDLVDVNIHPAKREIKFFDQRYVEQLISGLAKKTLVSREQTVTASDFTGQPEAEDLSAADTISDAVSRTASAAAPRAESGDPYAQQSRFSFSVSREASVSSPSFSAGETPLSDARVAGVVFGTYIIAEIENTIKIIDFHAAHERITFDALIEKKSEHDRQSLVFPEVIELSPSRMADARELLDQLCGKGFDVEEFSEDSIIIRAVPAILSESSVKDFFVDLLESREDSGPLAGREKRVAARIACHASKRANDHLTRLDMQTIVDTVLSGKHELTCPHGRPFLYSMSRAEFEKLFRR